ncbi:tetratricopeptide repeat protein [Streptomyces sp. NPDC006140]|uniref:tetratricopeptide repeat protein n=1 Tax=Streptomyces sp. NPDC006140 TaxID=3154579 RepID=UPI0033ED770A
MNHMGMSLLGREDETAEFEAFLQGDDRVLLYWGVAGQGKSTLVEHLAACCPKDGYVVDLEYTAGRRNPSSDSADAARELLDELAEVLGGWCGTGTPAYRRAADRADADEQALLTRNITLKATVTARGNSSIVDSPVSLSAGSITEPLANLRALNRSKLVRALCDDLRKADLSGRVLFVDTTERLYYLDEVAYFEASGGARGADEIGHWFANRFVPHLLSGAKGLKLVLAGREEVPMKSGIRCRRRELRNWSSTDSDAYLASRGQEADGFQQAVYRLCKGHPGWTSMLSDTAAILDWGEIDLFELERIARDRPAEEWLPRVFLSRIPEPRRAVVVAAATLRSVVKEAITAVLAKAPQDEQWFESLTAYSFVQLRRAHRQRPSWHIHPLVRGAILSHLGGQEPLRLMEWHGRAAAYFSRSGDLENELYHRFCSGDTSKEGEWHRLFQSANLACDYDSGLRVIELVTAHEVREGLLRTRPGLVSHALTLRSDISLHQGRLDDAVVEAEQALRIAREEDLAREEAKALFLLGCVSQRRSELTSAKELLSQAFDICLATGDTQNGANCQLHLGSVAARQADYVTASKCFSVAAKLYEELGDVLGEGNVHSEHGTALRRVGRYGESRKALRLAVRKYRGLGFRLGVANALREEGGIYLREGRAQESRNALHEALSLYREIGDRLGEAACRAELSFLELTDGDADAAHASLRDAASLYASIGNELGVADTNLLSAQVLAHQGAIDEALVHVSRASTAYGHLESRLGKANCLLLSGVFMMMKGALSEANVSLARAVRAFREIGNAQGERLALGERSRVAVLEQDGDLAVRLARRALHVSSFMGSKVAMAESMMALSAAELAKGRTTEAVRAFGASSALFEELGIENQAQKVSGMILLSAAEQ